MRVVAYLQNMWVKEPDKVQALLDRHKDNPMYWNKMCKLLLFAGCITGRRIKDAFGDLVNDMIFDETTKEIAGDSKKIFKPDYFHIESSLNRLKPDVVICFGAIAAKAVTNVIDNGGCEFVPAIITAPHPAARQPDTVPKLKAAAKQLRELLK